MCLQLLSTALHKLILHSHFSNICGQGGDITPIITYITRLSTSAAFSFKSCRWGKQGQDPMTSEGGFKEKPLSAKRESLLPLLCQRSFLFPFHVYNATFRMWRGFLLVYGDVFLYGSGEDYKNTRHLWRIYHHLREGNPF